MTPTTAVTVAPRRPHGTQGTQGTQRTQRSVWVDVLRGTLVLLVVVYHCYFGAVSVGAHVPEWSERLIRAMEPVRMPVLVMLSGFFLPRALAKGTRRYVEGKLSALVVPYVAWFLLFYFVLLGNTHQPTDRWYVEIYVPQTPLWFICYLIGFFAISLALRTPTARLLALGASLWLVHTDHDTDWHFLFYFSCFLAGSLLTAPPAPLRALWERARGWPLVALSLVAAYPTWWVMHTAAELDHTDRTPLWMGLAVCALCTLRSVALVVARTRVGRWLATLGPYTIVIFLVHTALFAAFPAPSRTLTFGLIDSFWLSLALAFGLSLSAVEVVRRHEVAWLPFDVRRGWRALTGDSSDTPPPTPAVSVERSRPTTLRLPAAAPRATASAPPTAWAALR